MLYEKLRASYLYLICVIISIILITGYRMDYSGNSERIIKDYEAFTFIIMAAGCYCINILLTKIRICKKKLFCALLLGILFTVFEFIGVTIESNISMFNIRTVIKAIAFICTRVYLFTAVIILIFNRLKALSILPPTRK